MTDESHWGIPTLAERIHEGIGFKAPRRPFCPVCEAQVVTGPAPRGMLGVTVQCPKRHVQFIADNKALAFALFDAFCFGVQKALGSEEQQRAARAAALTEDNDDG